MKFIKKVGTLLTVAFAAACASAGDIWEIAPLTLSGGNVAMTQKAASYEKPISDVGHRLRFRIRFIEKEDGGCVNAKGFNYDYVNPVGNGELVDFELNPMRVCLLTAGTDGNRWAKVVDTVGGGVNNLQYLDVIFEYVVQPCDFGLPVLLGVTDSVGNVYPASKMASEELDYFVMKGSFEINYKSGSTVVGPAEWKRANNRAGAPSRSRLDSDDLSGAGYFVKTIDFLNPEKREWTDGSKEAWSLVDMTTTKSAYIEASQVPTNSVSYFVWSDDESAVKIRKGANTKQVKLYVKYDDGYVEADKETTVAIVTFEGGKKTAGFEIEGVNEVGGKNNDGLANLHLSPYDNYEYDKNLDYTRVTNYLSIAVKCGPRPTPSVSVLKADEEADTFYVNERTEDWVTSFNVRLSEPFGSDVTVTVTPSLTMTDEWKPNWSDYLALSDKIDEDAWDVTTPVVLTFRKGEVEKTIYLYGKGADKCTWTKSSRICLTPSIAEEEAKAYYTGIVEEKFQLDAEPPKATLALEEGEIIEGTPTEVSYGESVKLMVSVADNYLNMTTNGGYQIKWKKSASDGWTFLGPEGSAAETRWLINDDGFLVRRGADGKATDELPSVAYSKPGINNSICRIVAPNGKVSADMYVSFMVGMPQSISFVDAQDTLDVLSESNTNVSFTVRLSEKATEKLYVYLEPAEDSKDYVKSNFIWGPGGKGAPLAANTTDVRLSASFTDGDEFGNVMLELGLHVSRYSTYDKAKEAKEEALGYGCLESWQPKIVNVKPAVTGIKLGTRTLTEEGGTLANVSANVAQDLTFTVSEPGLKDREATDDDRFAIEWNWTMADGGAGSDGGYLYGDPTKNNVTNLTFSSVGKVKLEVRVQDKDMREFDGGWSKYYTYFIDVVPQPTVTVIDRQGGLRVNEGMVGADGEISLYVTSNPLGQALAAEFSVKPDVEDPEDLANCGEISFTATAGLEEDKSRYDPVTKTSWWKCTIPNTGKLTFYLKSPDGTFVSGANGFVITPKITQEGSYQGQKLSEFFLSQPVTLRLDNVPPTLNTTVSPNDESNRYVAAMGALSQAIKIKVNDIKADLSAGVDVVGKVSGSVQFTTNLTSTAQVSWTPVFSAPGPQTIEIEATDKDDGTTQLVYYYEVTAAKTLETVAHGPSKGRGTTLSAQYARFAKKGLGEGRTYVNNSGAATAFNIVWGCGVDETATVLSEGYKVGDIDNGSLGGGLDHAISPTGSDATEAFYAYADDERDSYFYRLLPVLPTLENGGEDYPLLPEGKDGAVPIAVTLPAEKNQDGGYAQRVVESVYAKEYLPSDNMGDVNQDGVPDLYLAKYGFGLLDGGKIVGDDTASLKAFNDDGDYLPGDVASVFAGLSSGTNDTVGVAFTATMEIRGYDEHLNNAADLDEVNGVSDLRYTDPATDEKSTLSALEYWAFTNWCAQASLDATEAENWKKWSPECPTDPMKADTDADGATDGNEYFLWYRAHVGYVETDGTFRQFVGRRYNPIDPVHPIKIASDDVAEIYNPRKTGSFNSVDTDNDGLSDLDEFALGTNPADYDTDNDGLPDGWEVIFAETDPLFAKDDASLNTDADMMAACSLSMECVPVSVNDDGTTNYLCSVDGCEIKKGEVVRSAWKFDAGGKVVKAPPRVWSVWSYDEKTETIGFEYAKTNIEEVVTNIAAPDEEDGTFKTVAKTITLIHGGVMDVVGFDPRTAWDPSPVPLSARPNSRPLTNYDEFMYMAYLYRRQNDTYGIVETKDKSDEKHVPGVTLIGPKAVTATKDLAITTIWQRYTLNPLSADQNGDGAADGWEAYVGADPLNADMLTVDSDGDGLVIGDEFAGVVSYGAYPDCGSIVQAANTWKALGWFNKKWPTNPLSGDTDDDGVGDKSEGGAFIYGKTEYAVSEACVPGGGLNPNFVDTDQDGLPDAWETAFAGSYSGDSENSVTRTEVAEDGTTNTVTETSVVIGSWGGGMNGTVSDARSTPSFYCDYDHDGLDNWQEYMVGAMRCWRYDDPVTPWVPTGEDVEPMPSATADPEGFGKWWGDRVLDTWNENGKYNPFKAETVVDPGMSYFSRVVNVWDPCYGMWYMYMDGPYHDLAKPPMEVWDGKKKENRFTRRIKENGNPTRMILSDEKGNPIAPKSYICCDPRTADTDNDGMDDFYELFHGLNPLYGGSAAGQDVVAAAYEYVINAKWNAYYNYQSDIASIRYSGLHGLMPQRKPGTESDGDWDFRVFPWLAGAGDADPDGDNLRNQAESLLPGEQAPTTYLHTDPTPLWMTDTSYSNSLTTRFYMDYGSQRPGVAVSVDGFTYKGKEYKFADIPCLDYDAEKGTVKASFGIPTGPDNWYVTSANLWSFEENEGYDSDHDFLGDFEEAQGRAKSASDPQEANSPVRRQAMWFNPTTKSFLQTPQESVERLRNEEDREEFLYFTVECWAKVDAAYLANPNEMTLVERALWTGPSGNADARYLRSNFRIYLKGGVWYASYDTNGTDDRQAVIVSGSSASTDWTHVAAKYDGSYLTIYVNGTPVASVKSGVQPEHGTQYVFQDELNAAQSPVRRGNASVYVGASPISRLGLEALASSFLDYDKFYGGFIDEVRIWDGARKDSEILADFTDRVRYTPERAAANREAVYTELLSGGTRKPGSVSDVPAQLMYHFSFDQLPGAVDAADVITVPTGFASQFVQDAKAWWARPEGWVCKWWNDTAVRSTVYTDTAFVPWIVNTVAHLPWYDESTADSIFWSRLYAGDRSGSWDFHNASEVYADWKQVVYTLEAYPVCTREVLQGAVANVRAFGKQKRDAYLFGRDLLPMGGAFPKRIGKDEGGMWDDATAADAWAQTGADANDDGVPDWWLEAQGLSTALLATDPFRDTGMTIREAYLRDLAKGVRPGAETGDENFVDSRDLDGDGMPDWWEDLYGIDTGSKEDAMADFDNDGLSNYAEYQLSEGAGYGKENGYASLNPARARTVVGQVETDYFLRYTGDDVSKKGLYFGELVCDHDFMEDGLEAEYGSDRHYYDAWGDVDEDGWSNFSEMRYATFKNDMSARFISHLISTEEVADSPVPIIHTTLRYNGDKTTSASNSAIIVEAYAGDNLERAPSAVFQIEAGVQQTRTLNLGMYGKRVVHGTLTPGHVVAGLDTVRLQSAFIQPEDKFSWTIGEQRYEGSYEEMWKAWTVHGFVDMSVNAQQFTWADAIDGSETDGRNVLQMRINPATQRGEFILFKETVGEIDLVSGDFTLDLTPLSKYMSVGSAVGCVQQFYRLEYTTQIPALQDRKLEVSLANPDSGRLIEASTTFMAYMDMNGDGAFTPGEPMGLRKGVDVSWDGVPNLEIEMTEASQAAGSRFEVVTSDVNSNGIGQVTVVRAAVNGNFDVTHDGVFLRDFSTIARRTVHEGDIVSGDKFGLDYMFLSQALADDGINPSNVTAVTYAVLAGKAGAFSMTNDNILSVFTVKYNGPMLKSTPISPCDILDKRVTKARPTFKWTGPTDCVAYRIQIADAATTNAVYTSPVKGLPPRNSSNQFEVDADVWVGAVKGADNWSLANNTQYLWHVSMFNDKYPHNVADVNDAIWSDWAAFETCVATNNDLSTSYGCADVTVRYYGPATNGVDGVVVQLYKSADLSGRPVAQAHLDVSEGAVNALTDNRGKVRFIGLESGDYYACAFVDRNGDGKRQRYEIWGYSANVGNGSALIWAPSAIRVDAEYAKVPNGEVYMEDTDVNNNGVLDWLDDASVLAAAIKQQQQSTRIIIPGVEPKDDDDDDDDPTKPEPVPPGPVPPGPIPPTPTDADQDKDGLMDSEESKLYTEVGNRDTDADGMGDGWETKYANLSPVTPNGDFADGSVMAWAQVPAVIVTLTGDNETQYAVLADDYIAGASFGTVRAWKLFAYGEWQALGMPTNIANKDISASGVARKDVIAMHAHVYALFGYDKTTANEAVGLVSTNGVEGCANTKPMTALDKYLVKDYLRAVGYFTDDLDESTCSKLTKADRHSKDNPWWQRTLMPRYTDHDADGLSDGWELYVMFGTNEVWNAETAGLSPFVGGENKKALDGVTAAALKLNGGLDPWNAYALWESLGLPETRKFSDADGIKYRLQSGDLTLDEDLDGLSNYQEMLANRAYPTLALDVLNPVSDGTTPDYFRACGDDYYTGLANGGEFIEASARRAYGLEGLAMVGTRDTDDNGWDLWSEVRAKLAAGIKVEQREVIDEDGKTNTVEVVVDEGLVAPTPNVNLTLRYAGNDSENVVVEAYQRGSVLPVAQWTVSAPFADGVAKVALAVPSAGALKQGQTTFLAYIDHDGSGNFTAADTFGQVACEVGYLGATIEIRLGDPNNALPAFTFLSDGTNAISQIKVIRAAINGKPVVNPHTVYLRQFENNAQRQTVFPADYVNAGYRDGAKYQFIGLDPGLKGRTDIVNVTYEVLTGPGPFTVSNLNEYATIVTNKDQSGKWHYATNFVSTGANNHRFTVNYSLKPDMSDVLVTACNIVDDAVNVTFTVLPTDTAVTKFWIDLTGPAGARIARKDGDAEGGYLIPNGARGLYTINLYDYFETLATGRYTVRIGLGNDKFSTKGTTKMSEAASFYLNAAAVLDGELAVTVKHPLVADGGLNGLTVAAYETADLVNPAKVVTGVKLGDVARIKGLRSGREYYVAAWYADTREDRARDVTIRKPYDTWGYATQLGAITNGFDAAAFEATEEGTPLTIYLQDTDWNQNGLNDRLNDRFLAVDWLYPRGGGSVIVYKDDFDLDGLPDAYEPVDPDDPEEPEDPEDPDEPIKRTGKDVMAYFEATNMLFVGLSNDGSDTNLTWCAVIDDVALESKFSAYNIDLVTHLNDGTIKKQIAADLLGDSLYSTYDYYYAYPPRDGNKWQGVGTNVHFGADWKVQDYRIGKAKFVHAQVYALFGFDQNTCVATDDAVNTKDFTKNDKYLVARYLESIGVAGVSEEMMLTNIAYQWIWSLDGSSKQVSDKDRDGVADGWELYTMFGPNYTFAKGFVTPGYDAGSLTNSVNRGFISPFCSADGLSHVIEGIVGPDGKECQLQLIEEYNNGLGTSDPWSNQTDPAGLSDWDTYRYDLRGENKFRRDDDGDGLSNFMEYMISQNGDMPDMNAKSAMTFAEDGQIVPDYFLMSGKLYLGEMFSDHDMIEDWFEDGEEGNVDEGGVVSANYSRYSYDAARDTDGDGWSNWAEARAKIAAGYVTINVLKTNVVDGVEVVTTNRVTLSAYEVAGGRPDPTVRLNLKYNGIKGSLRGQPITIQAWNEDDPSDEQMVGAPDAVWQVIGADQDRLDKTYELTAENRVSGYLRGGRNTFVAFVGDTFVQGMPYGIVSGVEVSYAQADGASIELTDVNASIVRIDLATALATQAGFVGSLNQTNEAESANNECFNAVAAASTDRAVHNSLASVGLQQPYLMGTNCTADFGNYVRVRVLRSFINGTSNDGVILGGRYAHYWDDGKVLLDRRMSLTDHPILTEADLVKSGEPDIDWDGATGAYDAAGKDWADIESVGYRIVVFDGTTENMNTNNNLAVCFVNRFEKGDKQSPAKNLSVMTTYGHPTFAWTHENTIGKLYPAFRLQVLDGKTIVYDSGVLKSPARDQFGVFKWTAPVTVGTMTTKGHVIEADKEYTWQVTMLDSKFTWPNWAQSDLRMTSGGDCGEIAVAVKYMGPGRTAVSGRDNLIRVQAFATPDFGGRPVSEAYVRNTDTIAASDQIVLNAWLSGLEKGVAYYVLAFIDTNGNGTRDNWESWGYGNYIGVAGRADVYTPRAYVCSSRTDDQFDVPECVLYVEDADTNGNKIPDVWEWNKDGKLGGASTTSLPTGPIVVGISESGKLVAKTLVEIERGAVELPYYSSLTKMANGEGLSSLSLALAMSGIDDLSAVEATPEVKIESFDLEKGIVLSVESRATVDGETLVPKAIAVRAKVTLTLESADDLQGAWKKAGAVSVTCDLNGTSRIPDASLATLNAKIREITEGAPESTFFRVKAAVSTVSVNQ